MLEGLVQDFQLTLPYFLRRAEQLYGHREIVTRRPDKSFHRHTYADFVSRCQEARRSPREPRPGAGGQGGHARLEHLPAPGSVPSASLHRDSCCTP